MGAMEGVATLGVACSDKKSSALEANKQLCRDYFQAFLKIDTDWMKKQIAPTFVRHDPGLAFEVKGTHSEPLGEMAATGKKIDIDVLDLFQFKDGVLVEHWALLYNLGKLKQLGASA